MLKSYKVHVDDTWELPRVDHLKASVEHSALRDVGNHYSIDTNTISGFIELSRDVCLRAFWSPVMNDEIAPDHIKCQELIVLAAWKSPELAECGDYVIGHEAKNIGEAHWFSIEMRESEKSLTAVRAKFVSQIVRIVGQELKGHDECREHILRNYWKRV